MVVPEIDGVLYVELVAAGVVCSSVPPVAADHQRKTPEDPLVDVNATEPVPHRDAPVADGAAGAVPVVTVAVTAVLLLVHPPL
jgi:hypothetical protein